MRPGVLALLALGGLLACRAGPIPVSRRYPAGTPLIARFVTVDGTRLRYVDTGRGPAVVLVHGLAASIYSWRHTILPLVQAGYRVIAFDNRGFGFSDKPQQGYSNEAYVGVLYGLLDSLGVTEATLVGHSMGGAIVAQAALDRPERVHGLVLVDAAGWGVRWPFMLRVAHWPIVGALFDHLRGRTATAGILKAMYGEPSRVNGEDVDQYYAPLAEADFGRVLRGVLGAFRFDALRDSLGRLTTPTLVMWGNRDRLIPATVGEAMAAELPRSVLVRFPDGGHALPEEVPEAFNRSLIGFLRNGIPLPPKDLATGPGR